MKSAKTEYFSVDQMMRKVASSLVRDFQSNLDDPQFYQEFFRVQNGGTVAEIRELKSASDFSYIDPAYFKAAYQLDSLTKRYRYQNDIYSDDELIMNAVNLFMNTQDRICAIDFNSLSDETEEVLSYAQLYIAQVLGKYSDEEHRDLCRFGSRASVGIPARAACEAARWELPISGSQQQIDWFDSEMSQIDSVKEYWQKQKDSDPLRSTYQPTSCLTLTLVPKTFKSLRAIMPNTTIGSYMSFGLGEIMRKRLKKKGYDIRSLQMKHRRLAREASIHNLYTTADLSSASDSISVALVEKLFPPDWFEILNQSRIGQVTLPTGQIVESQTFCTMGIGYTFPLQTLVFLSLLKAIEAKMYNRWNRRTISVYGDDMIYVSSLHDMVVRVFEEIGFVINIDKTFHEGNFRESCGGDYFRGVDVRPFQPRNGATSVGAKTYEAMLYKFINGLLMRWSEHEIGRTLAYLCSQVELVAGRCKLVPTDFPDDSGIKCPTLRYWSFLQYSAVAKPKSLGHGLYRFSYLRFVSDERKETRHEPFLWLRLRGGDTPDAYALGYVPPRSDPAFLTRLDEFLQIRDRVSSLTTREVKPIMTFWSKFSKRRLRRTATMVTISHTGRYMRRSGTSCFEARSEIF